MLFARIYLPLALGYAISYFYRNANAIIEVDLVRDLGLGPADLGLLTSVYFISFAAFQLPLGVLLDRYGPRRTESILLLFAALGSILFLGGWLSPIDVYPLNLIPGAVWMIIKILILFFMFAIIKAIVPRYRYDQLMRLGWKVFLPFSLFYVVFTASFLVYFDLLPN